MGIKKPILPENNYISNNKLSLFLILPTLILYLIASFFKTGGEYTAIGFYFLLTACFIPLYKYYKEKYNNIDKLFLFAFFSIVFFPIIHNYLYYYNKDSYVFNQEYLTHRKIEIKEKLKLYNDVTTLASSLKYIPYKTLHSTVDDQYCDKWIYFKKNRIKVESIETKRPTSRLIMIVKRLSFYDLNSNFLGQLDVVDETIYDAYLRKLDSRNNLLKELNFPESNIDYADIWLDSITVFAFSNIKPISRLSQFIQVLQVISLFFTIHIFTAFLDEFGGIKIKKKNHSN